MSLPPTGSLTEGWPLLATPLFLLPRSPAGVPEAPPSPRTQPPKRWLLPLKAHNRQGSGLSGIAHIFCKRKKLENP
jgi:hypothetical protein